VAQTTEASPLFGDRDLRVMKVACGLRVHKLKKCRRNSARVFPLLVTSQGKMLRWDELKRVVAGKGEVCGT
jgi:hypothetical protein